MRRLFRPMTPRNFFVKVSVLSQDPVTLKQVEGGAQVDLGCRQKWIRERLQGTEDALGHISMALVFCSFAFVSLSRTLALDPGRIIRLDTDIAKRGMALEAESSEKQGSGRPPKNLRTLRFGCTGTQTSSGHGDGLGSRSTETMPCRDHSTDAALVARSNWKLLT